MGMDDDACTRLVEALRIRLQADTGQPVEQLETHISWLLLAGEIAYKIKKPVRLPFLDFSTPQARRHYCEEELRLNRRLAPSLYLRVAPIRGTPDAPRIDGPGPVIEHAVVMRRFPAGALFSERLAAGTLEPAHVDALARRIAAFHLAAAVAPADGGYASADLVLGQVRRALEGAAAQADDDCADLGAWLRAQEPVVAPLLRRRPAEGWVRECHGDLHLANAVLIDGQATAFDCIEFDPRLRWIDVQSDIAFLAMDLHAHGRGDLAWRFVNRWLDHAGDHAGLPLLRFYAVYRALVRAQVAAIRRRQGDAAAGGAAARYLAAARRLAASADPRLLVTHGLPGSGKSHAAQHLAERVGAVWLRSDVERKRLFGLGPLDASQGAIYGADASRRTYDRLRELAAGTLAAGYPTIVDAAFLRRAERDAYAELARSLGVPFAILHCEGDLALLRERVSARRARADDPSEADVAVLERQNEAQEPLAPHEIRQALRVDSARPPDVEALACAWRTAGVPADEPAGPSGATKTA